MTDQTVDEMKKKAIANSLPGLGSWVMKHGINEATIMQLSYEQMTAFLEKGLQMYEREMGKLLDPKGLGAELDELLGDEIPF